MRWGKGMGRNMDVVIIGVDIRGLPFLHIHGENGQGQVVIDRKLPRAEMVTYFATMSPCFIGMAFDETFAPTVHYWKQKLEAYRHTVTLMASEYVRLHGHGKTDAEVICKALKQTMAL